MIIIENKRFKLELSENCVAKSLVLKRCGEECIKNGEEIPFFTITQERPFNNETKLVHQNKRTELSANSVRYEDGLLIVGFELISIEAVVELTVKDDYVAFTLKDFIVPENAYGSGCEFIDPPPVSELKMINLPIAERENFGDWLNVMWDKKVAVNVLATSPYTFIDSEKRKKFRIMYSELKKDIKLIDCGAALIVSEKDALLDCIENVENDFSLPHGVKSRRMEGSDASIYWTGDICPENADKHIELAKKGGFTRMLVYYPAIFNEIDYSYIGDYDYNGNYPEKEKQLKDLLCKIKENGITPGLHFLHSHIGTKSRYVTPVADHRLNLTRHFTLSKSVDKESDTIYVEQNPAFSPKNEKQRVLKFGGEIIHYEGYTTEYPYTFYGCKRGHFDTVVLEHPVGEIGGVLDVSEFLGVSVYIDQKTSLQDEIAEKIAEVYDLGFEFVYFDGSEGTNPPYGFSVPYAQYRVYRRLANEPLFCEGAAKAHFGWHMLSGGNAFDVFPAEVFKQMIAEHPLKAVGNMANNFTRINFGWWAFGKDTQPDMYEYGMGKAVSCNCPTTVMAITDRVEQCARRNDVLEIMYRWEDFRRKKLLTKEQKEMLKDPNREFILLLNGKGEYELCEYEKIMNTTSEISAFFFERCGKSYVVLWHCTGSGRIFVPFDCEFTYEKDLDKANMNVEKAENGVILPVDERKYFGACTSKEKLIKAFENAVIVE